jgi:hypothetical protein
MARQAYIYREGVSPNTRLLNPQRVKVFAVDAEDDWQQVGLIQTWNPSDTRAIEPVRGVGFGDQIAELAVGVTDLTATATVMMMYLRDIQQLFGYKAGSSGFVRSLKHHQWPFDVYETIVIPEYIAGQAKGGATTDGDGDTVVKTWYEGCWMSDFAKTFDIGATSVTQDMTCQISDVYGGDSRISATNFVDSYDSNVNSLRGSGTGIAV